MPLTRRGSVLSERSQGRSSQVSGLPKWRANGPTAAVGSVSVSMSGPSRERKTGSLV